MKKETDGTSAGLTAEKIKNEWKKVVWPERDQVRTAAVASIAVAAAVAVFSAVIDSGMMMMFSRFLGI